MIKPTGSVPSRSSGEGAGGSLDRELAPEKAWFAAFDAWATQETSFNFPRWSQTNRSVNRPAEEDVWRLAVS